MQGTEPSYNLCKANAVCAQITFKMREIINRNLNCELTSAILIKVPCGTLISVSRVIFSWQALDRPNILAKTGTANI